jgi:hypothetical protein
VKPDRLDPLAQKRWAAGAIFWWAIYSRKSASRSSELSACVCSRPGLPAALRALAKTRKPPYELLQIQVARKG